MLQDKIRTIQHQTRKQLHYLRQQKGNWWKLTIIILLGILVLKNDFRLQVVLDSAQPKYASLETHDENKNLLDKAVAPTLKISESHEEYVQRYAKLAIAEMDKYGIPASIKLAQALHESGAGKSKIAQHNNNHFGIKCFSKTCKKNHCSNFSDDSHKDFFRKYENAWASYRDHSQFLQKPRYKSLYQLPKNDYKAWAKGLKKAGYATDKNYPQKLIRIIERLNLQRFDKVS